MATPNNQAGQIPVIDISGEPNEKVAKELLYAATTYGFVYVKSEGKDIPIEVIDNIFELSNRFFSSSIEEKEPYKILENNRGWVSMHAETLGAKQRIGDFKEAMNLGEFVNGKAQQPLPPSFVEHEAELDRFHKYCHDMMLKILVLFAIGLEIDPAAGGSDWFASRHRGSGPSGCVVRLLHYPPIPPTTDYNPAVDIRAGAHSDYGSITLLFQRPSQPGLEILPPYPPSVWTPVPVFPPSTEHDPSPPILVNMGDLLSQWTNNLLKSTVHRVAFPREKKENGEVGEDRYSVAYFGHPIGSTVLEPVPSKIVQERKGEGMVVEEMTADEHLMSRLKATYLSLYRDEEGKKEEATA